MADSSQRPPAGPGRNKSFRKAREAAEDAHYLDTSLEDVQKYFSPDTWKKVSGMHLNSVPSSSVQKYFDPVAWEKLQRLGCLRGRPSTGSSSSTSSSESASTATSPDPSSLAAARGCFSPRSWDALTRLNVVPTSQSPRVSRRPDDLPGDVEEDDGFLENGMDEDEDNASLSSAVRLDGLEGGRGPGRGSARQPAPRVEVTDRLRQYFSQDQWRKMEERGVLEKAFRRLSRETSV